MTARTRFGGPASRANRVAREAERLRRHNQEFRYALDHNLTIIEARRRLNQLWLADFEKMQNAPPTPGSAALRGKDAPALRDSSEGHARYWWEDDRL